MIAAAVVIRDSYDDAERVVDQIDQKHQTQPLSSNLPTLEGL